MQLLIKATLMISLPIGSAVSAEPIMLPNSPFDGYRTIRWEDEKARLDNFSIQLTHVNTQALGFILVFDQTGGCPGEAQARATRAKRYMVEYRGVPWNRIIWRQEGYALDISTTLLIVPKGVNVPYPYIETHDPKVDGPLTRACRIRLERIRKSRW